MHKEGQRSEKWAHGAGRTRHSEHWTLDQHSDQWTFEFRFQVFRYVLCVSEGHLTYLVGPWNWVFAPGTGLSGVSEVTGVNFVGPFVATNRNNRTWKLEQKLSSNMGSNMSAHMKIKILFLLPLFLVIWFLLPFCFMLCTLCLCEKVFIAPLTLPGYPVASSESSVLQRSLNTLYTFTHFLCYIFSVTFSLLHSLMQVARIEKVICVHFIHLWTSAVNIEKSTTWATATIHSSK